MRPSIGERLALAQARHEAQLTEQRRAEAAAKSEEEERRFQEVEDFYSQLRERIVAAVESGEVKVAFLMGSDGDRSQFSEACSLLGIDGVRGAQADPSAHLDRHHHKYYCLWRDFKDWLIENELQAKWEYRWDDGGIHAWHELVVQPNALVRQHVLQRVERERSRS